MEPIFTEAAVLRELSQPLVPLVLEVPALRPGQVLVDLAYSGVCHSQLNEARGRKGPDRYLPHTLGHEGSGVVRAVGADVSKVGPGDHVVVSWIKGRGMDVPGCVYASDRGPINSGPVSTFMGTTVTCESRVVRIPERMPLREAALLGCAIPTGHGMVLHMADLRAGQSLAVFGAGGIGLSAVLAARYRKAGVIVAVDVVDRKLDEARRLGATHLVNAARVEPISAIRELTQGLGVDVSIESAGRRETMEAAFGAVRDGGGLCIVCGNLPQGERIALDPFDLIRGKRIVGSWGGGTDPDRDIPRYAEMFLAGELDLESLVTREYGLAEINRALSDLEEGRLARALIHCGA
jgi:S-(hydroxymethyl)glutathione dehydrogenase/alcohol dehydrogenase